MDEPLAEFVEQEQQRHTDRFKKAINVAISQAVADVEARHRKEAEQQVDLIKMARLAKQLDETTDPVQKSAISQELTYERLRAALLLGQ